MGTGQKNTDMGSRFFLDFSFNLVMESDQVFDGATNNTGLPRVELRKWLSQHSDAHKITVYLFFF